MTDLATRCQWCGYRLDTCRSLREHQRKCCPDCEHTAAQSGRPQRCPTCDGDGPDHVDEDFTSGGLEMECGDDWHDSVAAQTGSPVCPRCGGFEDDPKVMHDAQRGCYSVESGSSDRGVR